MAVEEVGTGVGYMAFSSRASRFRLRGLGSAGEDDSGSKAGRSEVARRFEPGAGDAWFLWRAGESAIFGVFPHYRVRVLVCTNSNPDASEVVGCTNAADQTHAIEI